VIGGEELKTGGLKYWQERARGTRLINEYGPTETVVGCCVYEVNGAETGREAVPIGKPIANTQIYVLDRGMEPAPIGARGEIYIAGAGLARGYIGKPDFTGEKFVPNPFCRKGGERMYRTGDIGRYLSDRNIEFAGRADNQVKLRGYRIEPGEIQAVLDEHPLVRQSIVVASKDERGNKRLLGYVVGDEGAAPAELKKHLRERLPEYMIPEVIQMLEEMPLTANGKIDRKKLPMLKGEGRQQEQEYVAPRMPVEEIVVGIFEEVLLLDRVGVSDNFFDVGGHSLLAMQVVSRVRDTFGVEIEVRNIFVEGTPESLGRRIEEAIRGDLEERLAFWKKQLSGKLPTLDLPADYPRPSVSSYRGKAKSFSLSAELYQSLKGMSRREGVSLPMLLLAAFKTLIYRYTAQEDIVIGIQTAKRNRAGIPPLAGHFVHMLPIRMDLSGNPRFRELLRRVRDVSLGGYIYQDVPIEKLIEEIQPESAIKQMPLFNIAFGAENTWGKDQRMNGIKPEPMLAEEEMARFDLTLWSTEGADEMQLCWTYSRDLFEEGTVIRMHNHFETLLFNIVDRPDARLLSLNISSRAETGLSLKEGRDLENSNISKLASIKRKGIDLSTKPER
jgi:hypothetical protein